MNRCSKCNSPAPHLHPAMQYEGEVELCKDDYHRQITSSNTAQRIRDRLGVEPLQQGASAPRGG